MKKFRGSFSAIFTAVIAIALALGATVLFTEAYKERNIVKAEQFLRDGNTREALVCYKNADKYTFRHEERVLRGIIECSMAEGDYATARDMTEKLLEMDPDDAEMRFTLGKLLIKNKDFDSAKEQIRELRSMRTEETQKYADELTSLIRSDTVKGFIENLIDRVVPMFGAEEEKAPLSDDVSEDVPEAPAENGTEAQGN